MTVKHRRVRLNAIMDQYYASPSPRSKELVTLTPRSVCQDWTQKKACELRQLSKSLYKELEELEGKQSECLYGQYVLVSSMTDRQALIDWSENDDLDDFCDHLTKGVTLKSQMLGKLVPRNVSAAELSALTQLERLVALPKRVDELLATKHVKEAIGIMRFVLLGWPDSLHRYHLIDNVRTTLNATVGSLIEKQTIHLEKEFSLSVLQEQIGVMEELLHLLASSERELVGEQILVRLLIGRLNHVRRTLSEPNCCNVYSAICLIDEVRESSEILLWTFPLADSLIKANEEMILAEVIPEAVVGFVGNSSQLVSLYQEFSRIFSETTTPSFTQVLRLCFARSLIPMIRDRLDTSKLAEVCLELLSKDPRDAIVNIFASAVADSFYTVCCDIDDWRSILYYHWTQQSFQSSVVPKLVRMVSTEMVAELPSPRDPRLWTLAANRWIQETVTRVGPFIGKDDTLGILEIVSKQFACLIEELPGRSIHEISGICSLPKNSLLKHMDGEVVVLCDCSGDCLMDLLAETIRVSFSEQFRQLPCTISAENSELLFNQLNAVFQAFPSLAIYNVAVCAVRELKSLTIIE